MSPEAPKPELITHVPGMSEAPEAPITDAPVPEVVGDQVLPITNFSEAKAFKKWQDSQTPESQAAANAMAEERERKAAEQAAQLEEKAKQLAANPNAITEVPKNL